MMHSEIEWQPITNYPDYAISSTGLVMRLSRASGTSPGRLLKPWKTQKGYLRISLHGEFHHVHRLVACAFLGESTLQVNHRDGVKTNNEKSNLEFVTQSENMKHAHRTGLVVNQERGDQHYSRRTPERCARGECYVSAVLSDELVRKIRKLSAAGVSQKNIAEQLGRNKTTVGDVLRGKSWGHVQ